MAVPHPESVSISPTGFDGRVIKILDRGARSVRLANGHMITALPSRDLAAAAPKPGDRVRVELAFRELQGWRLVHDQPVLAAAFCA